MTSTPSILLLLRTGNASDRPSGTTVQAGELALSFGAADPGLYFEDSSNQIRKIGPVHYGTTAPNASPVGLPGNIAGELWTDSTAGPTTNYMKVWNGSAWAKVSAGYADTTAFAQSAATAIIASGSITAETAKLASGCILASGAVGATIASGAVGAITASGALRAVLASGCILASGAVGAIAASGAVGAIISSGTVTATGIPVANVASGLPAAGTIGSLYYLTTAPSGLYIYLPSGWTQV